MMKLNESWKTSYQYQSKSHVDELSVLLEDLHISLTFADLHLCLVLVSNVAEQGISKFLLSDI